MKETKAAVLALVTGICVSITLASIALFIAWVVISVYQATQAMFI